MKKLTKTQIAARLKKAGLTQIAQPNDEQFERKNTFWFEGRDLVVATDRSKNKALKALATDGHTFGGSVVDAGFPGRQDIDYGYVEATLTF